MTEPDTEVRDPLRVFRDALTTDARLRLRWDQHVAGLVYGALRHNPDPATLAAAISHGITRWYPTNGHERMVWRLRKAAHHDEETDN